MRVLFNGLSSYLLTGIGQYSANLLRALRGSSAGEVIAFPSGPLAPAAALAARLASRPGTPNGSWPGLRARVRRLLRQRVLALCERGFHRAVSAGRFDLYHEPNFIPWDCDLPTVVSVHDLSVLLHPEWHPGHRVASHRRDFTRAVARCAHVLTGTEAVRREIIAHLGVAPHRVTAVPNGIRPGLRPLSPEELLTARARLRLPSQYLLYVGAIEPRKNVLTLLRAYCALDEGLRRNCPLILAGPWAWGFESERAYYEREARHRGVRHVGYVANADLPALYSGATALVYPSHYEGFGLPPLEMMACGGAVLSSTAAALSEVCGRYAYFIEAGDEPGWHDALHRVITDAE